VRLAGQIEDRVGDPASADDPTPFSTADDSLSGGGTCSFANGVRCESGIASGLARREIVSRSVCLGYGIDESLDRGRALVRLLPDTGIFSCGPKAFNWPRGQSRIRTVGQYFCAQAQDAAKLFFLCKSLANLARRILRINLYPR
jgi:hypothetical protein